MNLDLSRLPEDAADLKTLLISLADSHSDLQEKEQTYQRRIQYLEERIRLLQNELFGRKSEKLSIEDRDQLHLFNEVEIEKEARDTDVSDEITIAEHSRKKRGRKPLPKDLPRVDVIHDLPEEQKVCACGSPLSRIGEEVCEKLDIIPAKVQVIRHIRYKYACKAKPGIDLSVSAQPFGAGAAWLPESL